MKFDLAGIHSFIFVQTLKPEWFKCSAKDHGPTVTVLAVLAVGGYGGGERWGIHSLVGGFGSFGGFGSCQKHRNRLKRLPNLKVAFLAVPYPFPSICE